MVKKNKGQSSKAEVTKGKPTQVEDVAQLAADAEAAMDRYDIENALKLYRRALKLEPRASHPLQALPSALIQNALVTKDAAPTHARRHAPTVTLSHLISSYLTRLHCTHCTASNHSSTPTSNRLPLSPHPTPTPTPPQPHHPYPTSPPTSTIPPHPQPPRSHPPHPTPLLPPHPTPPHPIPPSH